MKYILAFAFAIFALAACSKNGQTENTMTVDLTSIEDVAALNPSEIAIALTTNTNWIVQTSDWITPSVTYGSGDAIVSFKIGNNYIDENTTVKPRSGEIRFSGGGTLNGNGKIVSIPVTQLGHTYVDPEPYVGGIRHAEDMIAFLNAVKNGNPTDKWTDKESGEVVLLDNIDLGQVSDTQWESLADCEVSNANNDCTVEGWSFTGIFNGNNKEIANFNPNVKVGDGRTFGLFSALEGAEVKDLKLSGDMTVSGQATADIGMLAGTVLNSRISNVTVSGTIDSKGTDTDKKRYAVGGICGFACAKGEDGSMQILNTVIENCVSDIEVNAVNGSNTMNGATGAMYGGMVAFATCPKETENIVHILNCTNNGNMNVQLGRCSGIAATSNTGTVIESCTNNGDQTNTIVDGRLGNITCYMGIRSKLIGCVNYGDLTAKGNGTDPYKGTCAGLVALLGEDTTTIEGGGNYGIIKTNSGSTVKYGLLVAYFSQFSYVSNVVVSGGLEVDGSMIAIDGSNYMDYIGSIKSGYEDKITGLTWKDPENN